MNILNRNLKPVKKLRLRVLHSLQKILRQVLIHNPVRCRKKRQNMLNKVPLIIIQPIPPMADVVRKIHLLRHPKIRHAIPIKFPNIIMLNRKQHKPILILRQ